MKSDVVYGCCLICCLILSAVLIATGLGMFLYGTSGDQNVYGGIIFIGGCIAFFMASCGLFQLYFSRGRRRSSHEHYTGDPR